MRRRLVVDDRSNEITLDPVEQAMVVAVARMSLERKMADPRWNPAVG